MKKLTLYTIAVGPEIADGCLSTKVGGGAWFDLEKKKTLRWITMGFRGGRPLYSFIHSEPEYNNNARSIDGFFTEEQINEIIRIKENFIRRGEEYFILTRHEYVRNKPIIFHPS